MHVPVLENWCNFDGVRYRLHAWVVMPNHVHALIEMLSGFPLERIIQSWKSYTSKIILRDPVAVCAFPDHHVWQKDYWDRFIRDEAHYRATVDYIHQNPVKAGLVSRAEDWPWSSAAVPGSADGPPAF